MSASGRKRMREKLLESMVDSSARIAPGHGQVSLTLKGGSVVKGLFTKQAESKLAAAKKRFFQKNVAWQVSMVNSIRA